MRYFLISSFIIILVMFNNIAKSNSLFESSFIKIEIDTSNAYETKLHSVEEVKIKSLLDIASNILDNDNRKKFVKLLNNNVIEKLVQNIIIENEIITNQKYIAEIKINFDKKKFIDVLRDFKIDYSDIIPPPFLLISSYNQNFMNIGLDKNNQFFNLFQSNLNSNNYLVNYFFPKLDPNDRYILSYEKIILEDKNAYRKLLDKYQTDKALYININQDISAKKLKVFIKIFDENNKFVQIKKYDYPYDTNNNITTFDALSIDILHKLDEWWKKENQIDNSEINYINCIIHSINFDNLNIIKSTINDLSQVHSIRPNTIKVNNSIVTIRYYGDIDIFTKSLYLKGVILERKDNCLIFSQ